MSVFLNLKNKYIMLPRQVKASLWFLICSFMQRGISTITTPIFTRIMSTNEYGSYNVFSSWLGVLTVFITLNLSAGVYTQGLVKLNSEDEKNKFTSSLQGLTLFLAVVFSAAYIANAQFWNSCFSLTTVQMLAMIGIIWSTAAFNFWASEQRVRLNYVKLVLISLIVSIFQPILCILLVLLSEDKVTARILGILIINLAVYTILFFVQIRRGRTLFSKDYWGYALKFNLPLVPHYLSQTVLNSADRIMIDSMIGSSEAGIYSLAYSISNLMILFNTALLQTINPWIYQKIKEKKAKEVASVAYMTLCSLALLNLLLILFAPEIVSLFAPASYYDAIWVIPPIAMSVFFIYAYSLFAAFEFYYQKTVFIMIASVIGALLNLGLNYLFIPIYGYYAAGYTTLLCYAIYAVGHYFFMQILCKEKECGKVYDCRILFGISVLFVGAGILLTFTYFYKILRYSIIVIFIFGITIQRHKVCAIIRRLINLKNAKD